MKSYLNSSAALILLCTSIFMNSCAHRQTQQVSGADANGGEQTSTIGPQPPPAEPLGPEPLQGPLPPLEYKAPAGYVLVFGPGLARTMAYIGVLKEFEARHLAIGAIVGVEAGALVALLWSTRGMNALEWYTAKLKEETFFDFSFLGLVGKKAEGKKLTEFLNSAFQERTLDRGKIPAIIAGVEEGTSNVVYHRDGYIRDVLRAALTLPEMIKPSRQPEYSREYGAHLVAPYPVAYAKSLGLGKVIVVDVLGRGDNSNPNSKLESRIVELMKNTADAGKSQRAEADGVIEIPCDGVSYLDFSARAELSYQGRMAVTRWLQQEKHQ